MYLFGHSIDAVMESLHGFFDHDLKDIGVEFAIFIDTTEHVIWWYATTSGSAMCSAVPEDWNDVGKKRKLRRPTEQSELLRRTTNFCNQLKNHHKRIEGYQSLLIFYHSRDRFFRALNGTYCRDDTSNQELYDALGLPETQGVS